jgi:hypothetical protein
LPITLNQRLALWRRRLSFSRCVLKPLAEDTCGGSVHTNEKHADCEEC